MDVVPQRKEDVVYDQIRFISKYGDYYEFIHHYIIEATLGENKCEFAFVVDNK